MLSVKGPLKGVSPQFAYLDHPVWDEIAPKDGKGGFKQSEFEKPEAMEVEFLRLLYKARQLAGCPFRILDTVRDDPRSAHGEIPCAAVDLQVLNSWERSRVIRAAYEVGITRVGIYPGTDGEYKGSKKKDGGGIHLDASRTKPQDRVWTKGIPKKDK